MLQNVICQLYRDNIDRGPALFIQTGCCREFIGRPASQCEES